MPSPQSGEWVSAPEAAADRVLLYFHGGGFYRGAIATVREMVSRMSRASEKLRVSTSPHPERHVLAALGLAKPCCAPLR